MDFKELAEWIETRLCSDCKQGYTCDHFDCEQGKKVAELLRRLTPFRGRDEQGRDVSGWLIPS
ncbi:MAG: hypothetical protein AB1473_01525 [Thermodesulfobacteriota bacterium]